jgi:hypothetical protein
MPQPRHRRQPASGRPPTAAVPPPAPGDRIPLAHGLPLAAGALALVCALAYWNSVSAGLILDNVPIILQDPRLRTVDWASVRDILTHGYWWPSGDSNLYRPLATLTYWANYAVASGGESPTGYHLVNLLLHWLNGLLVFLLVRGVAGRPGAALTAAAVFACHPLTVESVTNVVGRADLLAALSTLGGLCLYRRFLRAGVSGRRGLLLAIALVYTAGLFSKESAVVLPALMLLHDWLFPPAPGATRTATVTASAARVWPAYAGLVPGALMFAAARWAVFRESGAFTAFGGDNPIVNAPLWTGVMTAVKVAGYYLGLIVWPVRLSCDYSYNAVTVFGWSMDSGQDAHAWIALVVVVALAAVALIAGRRQPVLTFFLGFTAIAYLPISNLLFPIGTIMAERLMYLPLVGVVSAAVLGLALAGDRVASAWPGSRRAVAIGGWMLAVAAVAALSARTVARNSEWTSGERLWSGAAQVVPASYKVHKALALAAMEADPSGGRVDEAIARAARGIAIIEEANLPLAQQPAGLYAEAGSYHLRKAQMLTGRGSNREAESAVAASLSLLKRAESIDRELNRLRRERLMALGRQPADIQDVGSAFIYRTMATAYLGANEPLAAAASADYLQRLAPEQFDAHYMRGVAEAASAQFEEQRGRPGAVEAHLERAALSLVAATVLNPGHRESWSLLAKVYGYVAPSPQAVILSGGTGRLNMANQTVARHVPVACAQLLALMRAAGQDRAADTLRPRMIAELGVPAAMLDAPTASPGR